MPEATDQPTTITPYVIGYLAAADEFPRISDCRPDSHPMFDGGRRLLQRAQALAGPRRVPDLALVPKA